VGRSLVIVECFTITLRHTTLGRTVYLTTNYTHNRPTFMLRGGFEPSIPASERPQTHALARPMGPARTEIVLVKMFVLEKNYYIKCKGDVGYCKMGT